MTDDRTYGRPGRLHIYKFRKDWPRFLKDVSSIPGSTVSRPAAAAILGCSRQRIHQLIHNGTLRCWEFEEGWLKTQRTYSEISVLDILEYSYRGKWPITRLEAMKCLDIDNKDVKEFFEQRKDKPADR